MKIIVVALIIGLSTTVSFAQEDSAEQLVASKQQADMTYRQLMEILGEASYMIHEGIIRENKQMVRQGADIILHHPAPNHKPWTIMDAADQEGFKQSLLTFDKVLDQHASRAAEETAKKNWIEASHAMSELNVSCISCHAAWKDKATR
ncbi:hypothetical protein [Sedimenticola hydrogenitrophicus]|uniref:hypothetical protein n=1 Tax=Sedimenticola hydrogenitrophicus TaxID=2967975 RepID=UPI0023B08A94|nr:hypothetical protein [Sedimenticola hydrogenitrophicus]